MSSRRFGFAFVAALLAAVTLAGCQTATSIADQVLVGSALRDLKAQLETLDGVTAAYDEPELQGDYSYTAGMSVTAREEASLGDAITDVRTALASDVFQRNPLSVSLTLDAADAGTATINGFVITDDQLSAELDRWHAVIDVLGMPANLSIYDNGDGTYLTGIGTDDPVTGAQLAQLSALNLPETETSAWGFPGLETVYLPDAEGREFFDTLTGILPPLSFTADTYRGVQLSWAPDGRWYVTIVLDDVVDGDLVESPTWPAVKRVVAASIDSGKVKAFTVQVANQGQGGAIHLGQCGADVMGMGEDLALLAALEDVTLPEGSGAGWC
jgi:hypothetical protein